MLEEDKKNMPLLLRACEAGEFGHMCTYEDGKIAEAGFIYLIGNSNDMYFQEFIEKFRNRMFICLSNQWEVYIQKHFSKMTSVTRWQMQPIQTFRTIENPVLQEGYTYSIFGRKEYQVHPFGHGIMYENEQEFVEKGCGAVIYYDKEIVSSASSYLTYKNEVELDLSTVPEHRRKGLAEVCANGMLQTCMERGLTVH